MCTLLRTYILTHEAALLIVQLAAFPGYLPYLRGINKNTYKDKAMYLLISVLFSLQLSAYSLFQNVS